MNVRKRMKTALQSALIRRTGRKQLAQLNGLIGHLRADRRYQRYPLRQYPPAIMGYSFYHRSDLKWLDFYYSVLGRPDPFFVSVPVYFFVETCLNHRLLTYALKEKNFLNKFMPLIPTPGTILRRINGFYYDEKFHGLNGDEMRQRLNRVDKFIVKPSVESGGGGSIQVFDRAVSGSWPGQDAPGAPIFAAVARDFIIQEYVAQHDFFSRFNPSSNNTVRVFTYRSIKDDSVHLLHCLLRVGARGSYLDHDHLGGLALAIDDHDRLGPWAIDYFGAKQKAVNDIALSSLGPVPAMAEIRRLAKRVAGDVYYGRLLALDFTVNREGKPLLLEINCWRNGIHQYQMHNGGLFREFTGEILDYCQKAPFTVTLSI